MTWNKGIPVVATAVPPKLNFTEVATGIAYGAYFNVNLTNTISVSSTTQNLQCSFSGGCEFEIVATGLSSLLEHLPNTNKIKICGRECVYDNATSDHLSAKCKLP